MGRWGVLISPLRPRCLPLEGKGDRSTVDEVCIYASGERDAEDVVPYSN